MTKRIIPALLLFVLLFLPRPTLASSVGTINKVDTPIADVVIYVEKGAEAGVETGGEFDVEVYIENIATKDGVIGDDLPLTYDRDRLEIVGLEPVFPEAWGDCGAFFGIELKDYDPWSANYPYYLRSLPDGADESMLTDPVYRITESKAIGYKLRFKALKTGEAFVAVENDFANNTPIMFVVIENSEVVNYGGRGMTATVDIVEKSAPPPSVVSGSVTSGDASSAEVSSEDISSAGILSEEASSEDRSSEGALSGEPSAAEISVESAVESAGESAGVSEISKVDESADEDSNESADEGGGNKRGVWIGIIVAAVVTAAGAAAVGITLWRKSKRT